MQVSLLRILCLVLFINEKRKVAYLQLFIIPVTSDSPPYFSQF